MRNLPKIEKGKKKAVVRERGVGVGAGVGEQLSNGEQERGQAGEQSNGASRKSANSSVKDLDTVEEEADN